MEQMIHIKVELAKRGKKVKDLAVALGWEYTKISHIINGYQSVTPEFDRLVRKTLSEWDAETERIAA